MQLQQLPEELEPPEDVETHMIVGSSSAHVVVPQQRIASLKQLIVPLQVTA